MTVREREPPSIGKYLPTGDGLSGTLQEFGVEVDEAPREDASGSAGQSEVNWLQRAREAYEFSTSYLDSNYRKKWENGIRAFNNEHPLDSKYASASYQKRSNIYKPKTRSVIRKNEAAASAALFSNPDAITTEANNQADKVQQASAEVMKQLIHYRLDKSIPWYLTVIGGVQDAQTVGVVISHQYWEYDEAQGIDKPCVDLIAAENFRIDQGADWRDPVNSSPYVIELIPMYVGAVLERMEKTDQKTGEPVWKKYGLGVIRQAMESKTDSTRLTRNKDRADPYDPSSQSVSDYEIVWVQRHIHRYRGEDWTFYMLGDVELLTDPVRLKEVVHHGKRPYVMGSALIETHKIIPAGIPELGAGVQRELNEMTNTTLDNQYFVLNKKWIVRRNGNVDMPALVRNVPGGVIMANDPEADVKEINWPEVNPGVYQQLDRLNADFADLTGDFSANQSQVARKGQEPAKIMALQAQAGTPLTEYLLRVIVVTWIEKVLRQLVMLEAEYETDPVALAIAGDKAKLRQKFGINEITDGMLGAEMTIRVNVGMGATDPFQKLQKFLLGLNNFKEIALQPPPGLNLQEVGKEIFGLLGFQDGTRFIGEKDQKVVQLEAQLQHAGQIIQELGKRHEDKTREVQSKEKIAHEGNITSLTTAAMSHDPMLSHAVMRQLAPGQGFSVPSIPYIAQEAVSGKDKAEKSKKEEAGKHLETVGKMMTDAHNGSQKQLAQIVQAMAAQGNESTKRMEMLLKGVLQVIAQGQEQSAQAIMALAQAVGATKTKETHAVKDGKGGFTMTTVEHAEVRQ